MRNMKAALLSVATGGALMFAPAWAATDYSAAPSGAHYRSGFAEPICSINTSTQTVNCTETSIGGIGNTNATLRLDVTYSATVTCTNRGGTTVDVKTQFPTSSAQTVRPRSRNGQLDVPAVESAVPQPGDFTAQATCPNPNWTKTLVPNSLVVEGYLYTLTFVGFNTPFISISYP